MPTPDNNLIDAVVADCIAADPALGPRESELREIVSALLAAKPDTKIDAAFSKRLRNLLTHSAAESAAKSKAAATAPHSLSFLERMQNKPLVYALSGGAVLSLLLVAVLVRPGATPGTSPVTSDESTFTSAPQISMVSANAFGSLAGANSANGAPIPAPMADGAEDVGAPGTTANNPARPQSGGGSSMSFVSARPGEADAKMIMPYEPVNYTYSYEGEIPTSDSTVGVYRHVKGLSGDTSFASFRGMLNGLLNPAKVQSGRIQNFTVLEEREYGYMISVDAVEGTLSLSQNWQKWPHPENECRDEACYQRYQIKGDQVPADAEVIAVADDFMSEYGIGGSHLGSPEVRADWRTGIAGGPEALSSIYAPNSLSVVYPLTLDGQATTDESGTAYGVNVSVNIRERKVDGLWGLTTNRYERSEYAAETDGNRILDFVRKGGGYGWTDPNATKTVEIRLGTPEIVLSRYWHSDAQGNGYELFVPMLRFPVLNPPADQPWFRKAVMVPLAKELLDSMIEGSGGVPTPILYMRDGEPAVEPAVTTDPAVSMPAPAPDAR